MKRLVLEPEHEAFRETVKQFIERELVPNAEQWESDRLVDRSAFVAAGKYGLIGFNMPEQYGGGGVIPVHGEGVRRACGEELRVQVWELVLHQGVDVGVELGQVLSRDPVLGDGDPSP